jgi:hypothetical protein
MRLSPYHVGFIVSSVFTHPRDGPASSWFTKYFAPLASRQIKDHKLAG